MCLFDISDYSAAAGAWARCCMHLVPGGSRKCQALFTCSPQSQGLGGSCKIQGWYLQWQFRCVFLHQKQPRALGTAGSSVLQFCEPLTRGDKLWSHFSRWHLHWSPSREKGFNHLSTTDFLKQFLHAEGEVITHFIKTLRSWFYLFI